MKPYPRSNKKRIKSFVCCVFNNRHPACFISHNAYDVEIFYPGFLQRENGFGCRSFCFFNRDDLRVHQRFEGVRLAGGTVAVNGCRFGHRLGLRCLSGRGRRLRLRGRLGRGLNRLRLRGQLGRGRFLFLIPASAEYRRQEEPYTEQNDPLFLIFSFHWPALFYPQTCMFSRCRMPL